VEQRLSILTLGVDDLAAMRDFYVEKFGWTPVAENKDIVFFGLNGTLLSFFEKEALAQDAQVERAAGSSGFSLAHNVRTEDEVDELFALLESKGVEIVKRPEKTFFGAYGGYVADVEGNLWDIACNPYVELDEQGAVVTHKDIKHLEQ
jgi:catechol 2,3-dioxygenase-like lactoylglutathione lyase family enzyme